MDYTICCKIPLVLRVNRHRDLLSGMSHQDACEPITTSQTGFRVESGWAYISIVCSNKAARSNFRYFPLHETSAPKQSQKPELQQEFRTRIQAGVYHSS